MSPCDNYRYKQYSVQKVVKSIVFSTFTWVLKEVEKVCMWNELENSLRFESKGTGAAVNCTKPPR
jgi:hypothetical protein